ncbi:hypothetical protein RJ641_002351 [Dillenia turbinata]|uniref:DUF7705 domain-containing protein n=1 Tax=Dillenia turbinata TaxID=194707 RepID=A0AAN8VSU0_9MAGN
MITLKSGNMDTYAALCPKNGHKADPFGPDHHFLVLEKGLSLVDALLRDRTAPLESLLDTITRRGMSKIIPESPNFKVRYTLNMIKGGGPKSQFYLMDIGSCWKNNGRPCNGDVTSDFMAMTLLINLNGAYHMYCSPWNAQLLENPFNLCGPYSNPQPQEILHIVPHPVWGDYGYPTKQAEGWIGDPRTWEFEVGRLSQSLYFYQDPGTSPAKRKWMSVDIGTEIYIDPNQEAEWTVSNLDIIIPEQWYLSRHRRGGKF